MFRTGQRQDRKCPHYLGKQYVLCIHSTISSLERFLSLTQYSILQFLKYVNFGVWSKGIKYSCPGLVQSKMLTTSFSANCGRAEKQTSNQQRAGYVFAAARPSGANSLAQMLLHHRQLQTRQEHLFKIFLCDCLRLALSLDQPGCNQTCKVRTFYLWCIFILLLESSLDVCFPHSGTQCPHASSCLPFSRSIAHAFHLIMLCTLFVSGSCTSFLMRQL